MQRIVSMSLFFHPGFVIVDHIHFQYNGFMFGILLWSILMARNVCCLPLVPLLLNRITGPKIVERNTVCCPPQFQAHLHVSSSASSLLGRDGHLTVPCQPAYFVYLLRALCLDGAGRPQVKNFLSLANSVIAVFVLSFGPFAAMGQIPQVLSRLFPFTRGLNHAYWAPNVWALVTALDRVLLRCRSITSSGNTKADSRLIKSPSRLELKSTLLV